MHIIYFNLLDGEVAFNYFASIVVNFAFVIVPIVALFSLFKH